VGSSFAIPAGRGHAQGSATAGQGHFVQRWWNLNTVSSYLRNNAHTLVNYGARHRKGLPISSSIAEFRGEPGCQLPYGQEATDALD
jgi:hypothetical protein